MHVVITPCTVDGVTLDETHYTNDPGQLLNKPFNFKVIKTNFWIDWTNLKIEFT